MLTTVGAGEQIAVVATVDAQTVANSEKTTDAVDMSKFQQAMFILVLGDMASETIDFRIETDSASAFNVDKQTLVSATQLAASATANDNKQVVLYCTADQVGNTNANHRYARGRAITGGITGGSAAIVGIGLNARYGPASNGDLSTVAEIKHP